MLQFNDVYAKVIESGETVWMHWTIFDKHYRTAVEALVAGDERRAEHYSRVMDVYDFQLDS